MEPIDGATLLVRALQWHGVSHLISVGAWVRAAHGCYCAWTPGRAATISAVRMPIRSGSRTGAPMRLDSSSALIAAGIIDIPFT